MFLKIVEFPKIWNLIFKAKTLEAKNFLKGLLEEIFKTTGFNGIFELPSEKFLVLPSIFEKFKEFFSSELLHSPCPFSFYLFEENPKSYEIQPLRTGKIYFEKSLKKKIENFLKESSIFYRITEWFELGELIFSVNVDPKFSFFFKDIFLTGKTSFCFFCHTTWHDLSKCPGLLHKEPWKNFDLLLKENLFHYPEKLWKSLKEEKNFFNTKEWDMFYSRYFFLFPSFLKIISYKFPELENWGSLNLQSNAPVRGGNLGLSLEALELGKVKEAEEKVNLLEDEDFRKSLVFAFCAIFKKDWDRAIYFLEDSLEKVKTNFLRGYLLFLKGYLFYYKGDFFLAEEAFERALKADPLCLPALYFLAISQYQREEEFSKVSFNFVHPWVITWMYLDPIWLKNQKEVEAFLENKILEKRENAVKRLKEGEDKFFELKSVMSEEDIKKYTEKIETVRKKIYEGGLKLLEKAEEEALELILELQAFLYNKIKKLQENLNVLIYEYERLRSFWEKYPYKQEELFFGAELKEVGQNINKLNNSLKRKNVSKSLKFILNGLEKNKEILENLKKNQEILKNKWFFRNRLKHFLKVFLLGEGVIIFLYLLPFFIAPFSSIASFLNFSWFIFLSIVILVISLISVRLKKDDEFLFMD